LTLIAHGFNPLSSFQLYGDYGHPDSARTWVRPEGWTPRCARDSDAGYNATFPTWEISPITCGASRRGRPNTTLADMTSSIGYAVAKQTVADRPFVSRWRQYRTTVDWRQQLGNSRLSTGRKLPRSFLVSELALFNLGFYEANLRNG
jgi:hypothetical protein